MTNEVTVSRNLTKTNNQVSVTPFINRGLLEIIFKILTLCENPSKKTHILYKANLSYSQLQKYLYLLIDKELCVEEGENKNKRYYITDKGRRFLKEFQEIRELLE